MGTHPIFESDFDCLTVEMRHFIPFVLALAPLVVAVDRNNFETCKDSSFCERRRKFEGEGEKYKVTSSNLEGSILKLKLEAEGKPCLQAEHSILKGGSARIVVEECEAIHKRYQVADQILVDGFELESLEIITNDEFVNNRNMLNIEQLREKGEEEDWEEKFKTHKDSRPRGPESVSMDVSFANSRHLYGLPEHTDSFVLAETASGEPYRLFNLDVFQFELDERMALYGGIPFIASHTPEMTAALLWLNSAETWVDIGYRDPEASISSWFSSSSPMADSFWLSETGKIDLFLFPGPTIQNVNDQYTLLTGRPQMPPQWATAYHQCKWNYRDMEDVAQVNSNFDQYDIPCDCIWLDIEHTDGKRYFTWDQNKFNDPKTMIDGVSAMGRKMVTIVDPHIKVDNNYYIYKGAQEADIY